MPGKGMKETQDRGFLFCQVNSLCSLCGTRPAAQPRPTPRLCESPRAILGWILLLQDCCWGLCPAPFVCLRLPCAFPCFSPALFLGFRAPLDVEAASPAHSKDHRLWGPGLCVTFRASLSPSRVPGGRCCLPHSR